VSVSTAAGTEIGAVGIALRAPQASGAAEPDALTPFCFMWAATHLLDLFCFPEWMEEPTGVALFLSATAVLLRPCAFRRVLLMCVSSLVYLYVRSPITPNHILFEGFVNLTLLVVALRHLKLPLPEARTAVFQEAVPVLRGLLLALYLLAFFHKLNWDFLTPVTSCAGFMLDGIFDRVGLTAPGGPVKTAVMWITLACEGGIPLLLLFPRTRLLAMLAAWPFHFALTFHPRPGIYAFSSMLLAMLTLFLPPGFYARLHEHPIVRHLVGVAASQRIYWTRLAVAAASVAVLMAIPVMLSGIEVEGTRPAVWERRAGMLLWMPYATILLAALLLGWPGARRESARGFLLNARRSPAGGILLLFIANGIAPYLGFQTVRTMSMFSNIRTEGDRTNHLFVPSSLQIADYQDDLVRVVGSSDLLLNFYAKNQSLLPFTEIRRIAWQNPDVPVWISYERAGRIEILDTSQPGAERQAPPIPFPLHKILAFREVDQDGRPLRCLW
jgi:hypothetical protein